MVPICNVNELVHNYEPWSNVACCSFAHLIWQPCRMLGAAADTRTDSNRFNIDRTHLDHHTNITNSNTITIIIIIIITIIITITITIIICSCAQGGIVYLFNDI